MVTGKLEKLLCYGINAIIFQDLKEFIQALLPQLRDYFLDLLTVALAADQQGVSGFDH
jgi:hypothetical protein